MPALFFPRRGRLGPSLILWAPLLLAAVMLFVGDAARCPAADGKLPDENVLRAFLAGEYELIGRKPDSAQTYTGRITLRVEGNALHGTRTVGGTTRKILLRFGATTADRIPVLRMRFTLDGTPHEATYQWSSDLDNYARLTGLVYRADERTKKPGLEAWFPIQR